MGRKIRKYFIMAVLCFSCILLFKSEYTKAYEAEQMQEGMPEAGMDEESGAFINGNCSDGKVLRIYLDGKSYIAVDVIFLVTVMLFVFILVLERR